MHAIQQVIQEIKKLGGIENLQEAQDLQQLVNGAINYLQSMELLNTQPVPRVNCTQHASASEKELDDRKMKLSLPRVSQPTTCDKMPHKDGPPASRTRSKTANSRIGNAAAARVVGKHCTQQLSQRMKKMEIEFHKALAVMDAETGKVLNYQQLMQSPKHKEKWSKLSDNEFGRLANGVGDCIKGTNTIKFIRKRDVPSIQMKDVTYGQFVCCIHPQKAETHHTRFVVGGNRINYPDEVATPMAEMLVVKLLFNSVLSTHGARFMTMDIANFYLMTPLERPEYVKIKLRDVREEIIVEYKLRDIATTDSNVYIEATKGMYGLPHAGLLANKQLEKRLNKHGYQQSKLVPGLWKHKTRPIQFTLVVDNFGVKYTRHKDVDHLKTVLECNYTVNSDWTGKQYIRITLDWDYKQQ
jgi:hypothetical protein